MFALQIYCSTLIKYIIDYVLLFFVVIDVVVVVVLLLMMMMMLLLLGEGVRNSMLVEIYNTCIWF